VGSRAKPLRLVCSSIRVGQPVFSRIHGPVQALGQGTIMPFRVDDLPREDKDGRLNSPSGRERPQARRLRRPAPRLRGLTPVAAREKRIGAVDGSLCPVPRRRRPRARSDGNLSYAAPATIRSSVHLRLSRISALATMTIFRMMATMATFAGLPAWRSASYFSLSCGLCRMATSAGI
jgi:hypothetical protein